MKKRVTISGALAQKPEQAGHTWQFLQYLLGFRRLGWDVLFIDWLNSDMCVDKRLQPCPMEESNSFRYFLTVMDRFGLQDAFALLDTEKNRTFGLSFPEVIERTKNSALLLNVMGYLDNEELLACAPRRVFLDTDPGFVQMWHDLGLREFSRGHDAYVTIGENIGKPFCTIPTCGLNWVTTPQPVVLDEWPEQPAAPSGFFTGIGAWRGPYGPVEYGNRTYGLRAHEFRRFFELPRRSKKPFQAALDIHPAEIKDLKALSENGWKLIDPKTVAYSPDSYRAYIQKSRAEFLVAKNMYVQSRSGWFSERSMCYLASGKPVLAQDTGLMGLYPTDLGLVTFRTLEDAAAGVENITSDYERHCRAARELAQEYFDSDKVLRGLLEKLAIQ